MDDVHKGQEFKQLIEENKNLSDILEKSNDFSMNDSPDIRNYQLPRAIQ